MIYHLTARIVINIHMVSFLGNYVTPLHESDKQFCKTLYFANFAKRHILQVLQKRFKFGALRAFPFGKCPDPHQGDVEKHRV